jgi:glycogen synthase
VITTRTGGTGEAVGDTAVIVPAGDVAALRTALDHVVLEMSADQRRCLGRRGREHALAFDRVRVFDDLFRTPIQLLGQTGTVTPLRHHDDEGDDEGDAAEVG